MTASKERTYDIVCSFVMMSYQRRERGQKIRIIGRINERNCRRKKQLWRRTQKRRGKKPSIPYKM